MYSPVTRLIAILTALSLILLVSGCGSSLFQSKDGDTQGRTPNPKEIDPDATHKPQKTKVRKAKAKLYKPSTVISLDIPPDLVTTTEQSVLDNLEEGKQNRIRVLPEIVGARIVKKGRRIRIGSRYQCRVRLGSSDPVLGLEQRQPG